MARGKLDDAIYTSRVFNAPVDSDLALRIIQVKLWLTGHTFEEVRNLSIEDLGDILGYWNEHAKADEKERSINNKLRKYMK